MVVITLSDSPDNLTGTVNVCGYSFVVVVFVFVVVAVFVVVVVFILQFSSVQDGICALGKAHMRSTLSLRSFL